MFFPVALPPLIFIDGNLQDITACHSRPVLTKKHGEYAMLFDLLLEHDIDWLAGVRRFGQDPATFARDDVGMERNHFTPGNEWEPRQPRSAHAVSQMQ